MGLEPAEEGKQVKLKRATYRHIEAEIYSYCDTVKVIEELRRDIILANGRQEAYGAVVVAGTPTWARNACATGSRSTYTG